MTTLAEVGEGGDVRIHCVNCGRCLRKRLCELGMYDGTTVRVIKNDIHGPVILKVKDSKLVIGRGQAEQIDVDEC